jgi:hypothetical protein
LEVDRWGANVIGQLGRKFVVGGSIANSDEPLN